MKKYLVLLVLLGILGSAAWGEGGNPDQGGFVFEVDGQAVAAESLPKILGGRNEHETGGPGIGGFGGGGLGGRGGGFGSGGFDTGGSEGGKGGAVRRIAKDLLIGIIGAAIYDAADGYRKGLSGKDIHEEATDFGTKTKTTLDRIQHEKQEKVTAISRAERMDRGRWDRRNR